MEILQIAGKAGKSLLRAGADGVTFENVRINDHAATNAADINLTTEGDVRNLRFSPTAK